MSVFVQKKVWCSSSIPFSEKKISPVSSNFDMHFSLPVYTVKIPIFPIFHLYAFDSKIKQKCQKCFFPTKIDFFHSRQLRTSRVLPDSISDRFWWNLNFDSEMGFRHIFEFQWKVVHIWTTFASMVVGGLGGLKMVAKLCFLF